MHFHVFRYHRHCYCHCTWAPLSISECTPQFLIWIFIWTILEPLGLFHRIWHSLYGTGFPHWQVKMGVTKASLHCHRFVLRTLKGYGTVGGQHVCCWWVWHTPQRLRKRKKREADSLRQVVVTFSSATLCSAKWRIDSMKSHKWCVHLVIHVFARAISTCPSESIFTLIFFNLYLS